jgi:hypothetical protein
MRCDDFRTSVAEGAPLDEAARGHLATCAACGEEFAALRALTALHSSAPEALRERVLAALPPRRAPFWPGLFRAAAMLLIGLGVGFVSGYASKPAREVRIPGETVYVKTPVEGPVPDDYVSNVAMAANWVYGKKKSGDLPMVDVTFVPNSIQIQSVVVDPKMRKLEQYCPIARQLGSLAVKRPDVVMYRKKEY